MKSSAVSASARGRSSGRKWPAPSLGAAFWKALVVELDLRCPKYGDQEANDRAAQSHSTSEPFDLGGQLGMIMGSEIAGDHFGHAAVNPASNGRPWVFSSGKRSRSPVSQMASWMR